MLVEYQGRPSASSIAHNLPVSYVPMLTLVRLADMARSNPTDTLSRIDILQSHIVLCFLC
jgi:hypothetical protein